MSFVADHYDLNVRNRIESIIEDTDSEVVRGLRALLAPFVRRSCFESQVQGGRSLLNEARVASRSPTSLSTAE
jgi:hypothetical protein